VQQAGWRRSKASAIGTSHVAWNLVHKKHSFVVGVLPATRRVWLRTQVCRRFTPKSRSINHRSVGRFLAISVSTALGAEEVTHGNKLGIH
jgi:hypothetical protein